MKSIYVCDTCAPAIVKDDYSGVEDETAQHIAILLETYGYMVDVGEYEESGYWACDGCQEDTLDTCHVFTQLEEKADR